MKEEIISFETAKLAKNRGFDWNDEDTTIWINKDRDSSKIATHPAPTQSLLQKWLRKEHSIHIQIQVLGQFVDGENKFYSQVIIFGENKWISKFLSDKLNYTYEEALERGLQEALGLIK